MHVALYTYGIVGVAKAMITVASGSCRRESIVVNIERGKMFKVIGLRKRRKETACTHPSFCYSRKFAESGSCDRSPKFFFNLFEFNMAARAITGLRT